GIRDRNVTGVQTCALPISAVGVWEGLCCVSVSPCTHPLRQCSLGAAPTPTTSYQWLPSGAGRWRLGRHALGSVRGSGKVWRNQKIGRASCRERMYDDSADL